jgi:hypothetical protein
LRGFVIHAALRPPNSGILIEIDLLEGNLLNLAKMRKGAATFSLKLSRT